MASRRILGILTALCAAAALVVLPVSPALAQPSASLYPVFPGLPATFGAVGLTSGQQYDLHADLGSFSPATVTAKTNGRLSSSYLLPGASTATSVNVWVTAAGDTTVLAAATSAVQAPYLVFQHEESPQFALGLVGFAAGEHLHISYPTPYMSGPTTAIAPATYGAAVTTDGSTPFPAPKFTPQPDPHVYRVTVVGQTYQRTATATWIDPGTMLRAGRALRVPTNPDAGAFLLQSPDAWSELVYDFGDLELLHSQDPNSYSLAQLVTGLDPRPSYSCASSNLTLATNGGLYWFCYTGAKRSTLWTSGTAGTGLGNTLQLNNSGILTIYNVLHQPLWNNQSGRQRRISLTPGATLVAGQRLANNGYSLLLQRDGNLVLRSPSGHPTWSTRTHGTGAHDRLLLRTDGNLVLYGASGHAIWSTHTRGSGVHDVLTLQRNGRVVLRNAAHAVLWATPT